MIDIFRTARKLTELVARLASPLWRFRRHVNRNQFVLTAGPPEVCCFATVSYLPATAVGSTSPALSQPRAIGPKVSDEFTVALCRGHHRQLHQAGDENAWWENINIDALAIAKGLWDQTYAKDEHVN